MRSIPCCWMASPALCGACTGSSQASGRLVSGLNFKLQESAAAGKMQKVTNFAALRRLLCQIGKVKNQRTTPSRGELAVAYSFLGMRPAK